MVFMDLVLIKFMFNPLSEFCDTEAVVTVLDVNFVSEMGDIMD